jgi:DNA-binding transcriptional MerR regulator
VYQAKEFAKLAGVTVRALHHYDRLGLLKPKRRTPAGYRLYEPKDLERLEQVVALKYVGLSLEQIRPLLERDVGGLLSALRMQRRLLEEKRILLNRAIHAITSAEQQLSDCGAAQPEAIRNIIEAIEMENREDWMSNYATEEGRAKMEARKHLWSPELQQRISQQWNDLITDVEASLGEDPAGEKAQSLAARWKALIGEFTGRDKDIEQSVGNVWANRDKWPSDVNQKASAIKPEVWQFIARANQAGT